MNSNKMFVGTIMLEAIWESRHKDLIDLISPFVVYAVSKKYTIGETIDQRLIRDTVRREFGYDDLPIAIIDRVFKREKRIKRIDGKYQLSGRYDKEVETIEKRHNECERIINEIGIQLSEYLSKHMTNRGKYTSDIAINELMCFFSKYGICLGLDRMEEHREEFRINKNEYHIAQFIYEMRDQGSSIYKDIIELVKGYFLKSAIYLQGENGSIVNGNYKSVEFYYDTPFLLRLLGYKTDEDNDDAIELHRALSFQRGLFYYFPQTEAEINNILTVYARHIGKSRNQTLEGLDSKKYSASAVERLRSTWESKLASVYGTTLKEPPPYTINSKGSIDESHIIDETGLEDYLSQKIKWSGDEARRADLDSILAIHRIRKGIGSSQIEHCKAVFVTTNVDLARETNRFYADNVNRDTFPLLITDADLSALTWIKCGSTDTKIPETHLLKNAYMATQPTPELLDRFERVIEQMQEEGTLTPEVAMAIRESHYARKELLFSSFDPAGAIDENLVGKVETKLREEYSNDARMDERYKAKKREKAREHELLVKADTKARGEAKKVADIINRMLTVVAVIIEIIIICISFVGIIYLSNIKKGVMIIPCVILFLLSLFSAYDTIRARERFVAKWIIWVSDRIYKWFFDKKQAEYYSMLKDNVLE